MAPDTQAPASSSQLADVLSGGNTATPVVTPSPQQPANPPDVSTMTQSPQELPPNLGSGSPTPPPPAAGQPSVWKDLAMGALWGLTGASRSGALSGRGHGADAFAAGVGSGVTGVLIDKPEFEMEQKQKAAQIQFQSAEAADNATRTLALTRQVDNQTEETKLKFDDHAVSVNNALMASGQEPLFVINSRTGHYALNNSGQSGGSQGEANPLSVDAQAMGTLQVTAAANGGKVPTHASVVSPHSAGSPGEQIGVMTTTPGWAKANPDSARYILNQFNSYNSPDAPPLSQSDILQEGAKVEPNNPYAGVAQLVTQAKTGLFQAAAPSGELGKDQAQSATLHMQADRYAQLGTADPKITTALQDRVDAYDSAMETSQTGANKDAAARTKADQLAKESTPGGQAEIAKNRTATAKEQFELGQEKRDDASLQQPDATGFTPSISRKEYDKRYDAFTKSKEYTTLQTLQGSYQEFQGIQADLAAGKDMTGSQSVVGLFNAIGISATPLAGKGMRINNNTIQEHVNARGVGQSAYQKLLGLKNGDVITPKQLNDYADIAAQVYRDTYVDTVDEAHRQGLPADFLPKGGGARVDPATVDIYMRSVLHTNPALARNKGSAMDAAKKAAAANGWAVQ